MTKLEIRAGLPTEHTLEGFEALFAQPDNQAIAADRASCQVANKAEVEQVQIADVDQFVKTSIRDFADFREDVERLSTTAHRPTLKRIRKEIYDTIDARVRNSVIAALASRVAPPATTGASTELRDDLKFSYNAPEVESYVVKNSACLSNGPANFYAYLSVQAESFDKWEKCVAERADGAREVVELQFKVGDQEWSGSFRELFKILAKPVGASTVLTDERIEELIAQVPQFDIGNYDLHLLARNVEREVAAQAGQVAVLGWKLVPEVATPEMCDAVCESTNFASNVADQIYRTMIGAAPSPAKESK